MKKVIATMLLSIVWSAATLAAGIEYRMRVDGLACPYCAYGIEKKLKAIDGVEKIDVNLNAGLVVVDVAEGVELTGSQMKTLFQDAGFTYRSMTVKPLEEGAKNE
ncbi:mercuric ion binding protein [Thiogranum longum]|uniref:Mercuric ion binding protein n=1 Tax=Thiogranum longum TaxID=1537524 RepID=A0A4R1HC88_9GAMM|nr:heavy-metal-associated domain-containing protein [Thiogranum longum]TCK17855.1 mercuric ion binding protein [Thiogranum longum]